MSEGMPVICITIIAPRVGVRRCRVSASSTVCSLSKQCCLPGESDFIFNGELLEGRHTLGFYGIQNDDALVAVPVNGPPLAASHWMRATRDYDGFLEAIHFSMNDESRLAFLRLKDLRAKRLECRPRAFRKFGAWHTDASDARKGQTIVAETPSVLPCSPLPVCW
jgi:hypothetical protein